MLGKDRSDMPANMQEEADAARTVLVEAAAEADDALIEKYFNEGTLTNEEIRDGMRKAARDAYLKTVPVFVTSGANNVGTVPLMEALMCLCWAAITAPGTDHKCGRGEGIPDCATDR